MVLGDRNPCPGNPGEKAIFRPCPDGDPGKAPGDPGPTLNGSNGGPRTDPTFDSYRNTLEIGGRELEFT